MIIYIAGKYVDSYTNPTKEGTQLNINKALDVGIAVYKKGHYPVIPHLNVLLDDRMTENNEPPRENSYWYDFDNLIIPRCDGILRICNEGISIGADKEVELAKSMHLHVFDSFEDIPIEGGYTHDS